MGKRQTAAQKRQEETTSYKPGLSTEEKAKRRREAVAAHYRNHPEMREKKRLQMREARARKKAEKRRWDPPKKKRMTPIESQSEDEEGVAENDAIAQGGHSPTHNQMGSTRSEQGCSPIDAVVEAPRIPVGILRHASKQTHSPTVERKHHLTRILIKWPTRILMKRPRRHLRLRCSLQCIWLAVQRTLGLKEE